MIPTVLPGANIFAQTIYIDTYSHRSSLKPRSCERALKQGNLGLWLLQWLKIKDKEAVITLLFVLWIPIMAFDTHTHAQRRLYLIPFSSSNDEYIRQKLSGSPRLLEDDVYSHRHAGHISNSNPVQILWRECQSEAQYVWPVSSKVIHYGFEPWTGILNVTVM